jgi:CHAD domain-containing protein
MLRAKTSPAAHPTDGDGAVRASPRVRPGDPAASAVQAALAEGLYWLDVNRPAALEGLVEGVHHMRTTTRRLRSALELFRGLTDPSWADRTADELKRLAGLLGAVRDLDVLIERFSAAAGSGPERDALGPLFDGLEGRHADASAELREALVGERYGATVERLALAVAAAPFGDDAWEPCETALPALVRDAWNRLKRSARALTPDSPDPEFHEVRKRAKRARYAAEAVGRALVDRDRRRARRFARRAKQVQDVLGAHQDAVVAAGEIRRAAGDHPGLGPFNFAAGKLLALEEHETAETRGRFFEIWPTLDRKKVVGWLGR